MLKYIERSASPVPFDRPEDMPPALHRLLVRRGIDSAEAARRFLNPAADSLYDPLLLPSMDEAAARVNLESLGGAEPPRRVVTPEDVARCRKSYTGRYLKEKLNSKTN